MLRPRRPRRRSVRRGGGAEQKKRLKAVQGTLQWRDDLGRVVGLVKGGDVLYFVLCTLYFVLSTVEHAKNIHYLAKNWGLVCRCLPQVHNTK